MAQSKLNEQKQALLDARLEGLVPPAGEAPWARAARDAAVSRLRAMGLAHPRDEYWKFTPPGDLTAPVAPPTAVFDDSDETPPFDGIDRALRVVFVDGVFDAEASDPLVAEGLEIGRLSEALRDEEHWVSSCFGTLEAAAHDPVARPLAALNTALATDGVVIRATARLSRPVQLSYLHRESGSDVSLHHVIRVEPGAALTVLENGPAAARFSAALEVDVADGAAFHYIRTQGRDHERRAVTGMFGRLGRESLFKSFTMTVNGVLTRNECVLELTGDDALAHVAGVCLGDGDDFHHDDTVFITHDAANCESRQVFKKVLRNGATGVFQGKILVRPDAQKTDGYQISQGLLLDGDSQFLAKPELEIYADDVACSHGSTCGDIDEEALFYLRARGVPQSEAVNLLTIAFLAEALDEIEDEDLAADMLIRLEGWLRRHRG